MRPRVCTRFIARTNHTERSKYSARCRAGTDVKGVLMRTFSPRLKSIGAILATAALLLGFTASAQASTEVDFVSNGGSNTDGSTSTSYRIHAQGFVTGDETGYGLVSLILYVGTIPGSGTLQVTVHEATATNLPGTVLHTLTNPSNMGTGYQEFWFPANATLLSNTQYWLHITYATTSGVPRWNVTNSDDEDDDTYGWVIDNYRFRRDSAQNGWGYRSTAIKFKVKGHINDPPTSAHKTVSTNEDDDYEFGTVDFEFMDTNNVGTNLGETLDHLKITSLPEQSNGFAEGTLSLNGTDITISDLPQTVTATQLGNSNFKYIPSPNLNGFTNFGFKVNDGWDDSASGYTIIVDVNAVNDAPTSADNKVSTSEDVAYTFQTGDFDYSDIEGSPFTRLKITSLPGSNDGTLSLAGTDISSTPQTVTATQLGSGDLKYTPPANSNGPAFATFNFKVNDGTADSASAYTMTIDVVPEVSGLPTLNYAENGTDAIGTYTANGNPTWSLSGTDNDKFSISATGVLSFDGTVFPNGPDAENPVDVGTNNVYDVTVQATVSAGSVSVTGTLEVTVTVTDVNEFDPVINGPATIDYAENGTDATATYTITDADTSDTVSVLDLTGNDSSKFSVTTTGNGTVTAELNFTTAPNYEIPTDSDTDNDYEVTLSGSDGSRTTALAITVTVTDVDDISVFGGALTGAVTEGSSNDTVDISGTLTISDEDDADPTIIAQTDTGGTYGSFSINSAGAWIYTFDNADPDTNALDVGDTVDDTFTVTASDNNTQDVEITISGFDDAPTIVGPTELDYAENDTTAVATYSATDPDDTIANWILLNNPLFQVNDYSLFEIANLSNGNGQLRFKTAPNYEVSTDDDDNGVYRAIVAVLSNGSGKLSYKSIDITVTDKNDAPVFDGSSTTRNIDENSAAGTNVGSPVIATDEDTTAAYRSLAYSLASGADASFFAIDESTGQITVATGTILDYETKVSYSVTVQVTDDKDADGGDDTTIDATIDVTINLNDIHALLSVNPTSVAEDDGATTVTVTATLEGNTTYPNNTAVPVMVAGSEVDTAVDFASVGNFTITILTGATSATGTFTLTPTDDSVDETNETLTVSDSNTMDTFMITSATLSLTDDDATPSGITLSVNPTSVAEEADATNVTVTATVNGTTTYAAEQTVTVAVGAEDDAAKEETDYALVDDITITIPAGAASATGTFSLDPTGDVIDEGDSETLSVEGSAASGVTVAETMVTITDNDATPSGITLSVDPTSVAEEADATNVTVTATVNGTTTYAAEQTVTVAVGAEDDAAKEETDYALVDDITITIPAGAASATGTFSLDPTGDVIDEGDSETLSVEGSAASGVTVAETMVTITDNDATPSGITLSVDPTSVAEEADATDVTVTATVNGTTTYAAEQTVTVAVGAEDDAAKEETDYALVDDITITILAGAASATGTFSLDPTGDVIDEGDSETLSVEGSAASGVTVAETMVTITDNDATPSGITLSVNPTSVAEEADATNVTVTATVNGTTTYAAEQTVTVAVGAEDDAAKEETDYALVDDITITIPAGAASATGTFSLDPTGDVIDEGDSETLSVEGSAASGVTVAGTMVTITDNDATPSGITLSVDPTSVAEEADATNVTVTATVNGTTTYAAEQTVTVAVGAEDDAAKEETDYALVDDITITIPAGAASAIGTFSLDPTGDVIDEGDSETLSVEGSAASGVTVAGTMVTITDNDATPSGITLSVDPTSVAEADDATNVTVTATVNGTTTYAAEQTVTVVVGAQNDEATEGTDYTQVNDITITIPGGDVLATGTFSLDPTGDMTDEGDSETLSVEGSAASGVSVTGAVVTITDDDVAPSAPVNFQAIAGDARVTLTWDTANDNTISRWEYQQKQGTGDYGAWTSIASSDADTTAHALENLTNNTQYTFRLRAVNAAGNGASSGEQSATPTAGNNPPTVQNRLADLTVVAGATQDVDVSETFDDHDDDTLTYTAISANTSLATVSLSGTTLTVSGVVAGDTTVTVSASDSSASALDTFAVTVETDTQPGLAAIADQSYTRGVEIAALTLPSSSTGNGPLTYSLSPALPAGLSFDAATRTLSGTPTGLQASTSYTYKVVDANADEATQSFNITVLAPLPAAPINFQAIAGDARVTLTWDTANDDTISSWEYQQKQGTGDYGAWTSIASSDADTTAHALENLTNDTQYTFRLRAVNATGNGASSGEQSATPTAGNNPPTVQNPIADLTVVAGATQDVDVSETFDDHDDDTLTYTASSADTSVATVSLSGTTLTVSGVAAASDTTVTVSASDSSASASDTFAVTVETDTQPGLAAIADQSYTRGVEIAALTLPSSSTGNGPLTYSLSPALPAGLSFDAATRTLSGTPTGLQASTSYTYKVVDANADEATQSFNITVLAPLPAAPVNFQAIAGDARVTLTWDTANDDTISSWEYQQKQGTGDYGAWTSIASSDADTTAHELENLTNDTQYTFQLRAVNATGNGASSGEQSATPTAGNNPPTVQNRLADLTVVAGATQDVDVSETFDDHDDDTLTYTASSADTSVATVSLSGTTLTVSGVAAASDTTVTVSASDSSASASDTFAVTVETDTQPGLAAIADQSYTRGVEIAALTLPSSSTGNGPLTYSLSPALPAGLSFDAATRTLSGTPTGLQASTSYTYKVVDANADEATQSFNITVLAPLPAAPVNFQAIAGDARVTLTWDTANDDTISSWEYQQKQGTGGTYGAWTSIASSDADTTAHALENLTNNTQYTFQLRAVNATGNGASSTEQSATPTAGNNPPTVQNPIADLTVVAGATQDVDVSETFDDHDDDTLTYTAISADTSVATVSLSGTTLTVSGVAAASDTTVTVSASDSSASASDTFAVTVETDTQPVLAAIADQSYTRGVEIAALTLPSSSTGNGPLTYSLSPALPAGLGFDAATRTLSGTPTGLQASTSYTYKVVDANADEATQSFNIMVLAPLPAAPGNFQAIAGDARVTLTWDPANDDTISRWEYQQKQGTGDYGAWTSIASSDADTTAHALENLTNDTQYFFRLRAVNATGNGASSGEQSATPTAGNNPPTVQNRLADLTVAAGATQDVDVSETFDDHDDDTLTYTASSADTSVATVSLSGTTLTVSGVAAASDTTVTVSASDNSASASDTFAVTVETDTQPGLAAIADQSYTRGVEIEALTLPSSSTGNGPLTYSLSPALPAGLSFDAATRTLSGTPTGLQASTSYTYKVVDANTDEATQSFNITVLAPLPAAPGNFQAIAGDARVTLTWDPANDDTISRWEYQQKQGTGDYGAWTSIASSDAGTTAHALENLTNDTQYTFRLRAVNATGNGASSGEQSAIPTAGNNPPTVQNRLADLTVVAGATQDVDVSETFDDHDDDTLTYTASSADTSVATVSLSGTTLTVSGVAAGDTTVTVSASDSSASASDTFAVTVETDTQPVLAAIADQSYTRGVEIAALTLPSSSTGNGPLTYSLSPALPAGLSFDAATRTLSGTPTGLQASTSYTYKVVDANADEATQSFNITVLAPLPAAPVNFQAIAGDARVTLTWDTANDDTISSWEYQQKQGSGDYGAWTSIASSDADTTAHALENLTNNTQYTFQLRAVNATGNGASSTEQSATPTAGNNPPTVQNPIADLTVVAGATQDVDVSETFDDHDDDTLTYTAISADTSVATVSLSGTTLTVSGVAAASDTTVTVSASDSSASASDTFAVKVETDTQPVLAAIADQSYTRGVEIAALTLPSSSTGNGPLTYSLSPALPAGLSFDAATRTLSGTPTGLQASTSYTYKVVDANADEATQSFNIMVLAPLPAAPVNFQAIAGDARVTLTWDTANDDTISSWEYQQKQGTGDYGAWTSIASSDADTTAHALENLTNNTQYTFRLRAVNATGNGASSGEQSATPTAGNNPPTVQNPIADLTVVAGATQDVDVSETFDDHDDDTLTYTASPADTSVATVSLSGTTLTVSGVAAASDTTVTVSASDNSASASDTFAVTVETDTQPVLAAIADQSYTRGVEIAALTLPSSSTGNGPLTYSLSPALPAGLGFDAATRTLSGTPTGLQAATSYTYKVVDANADEATQSFNITVLAPLPAAPVNFQAIAGDARATLTWDLANDDTISRWEYQQKQGTGDYGAWTSIASSDAGTTAHALENLTNDTQYTFRLRAVNATGNGASSGEQSAIPAAGNNPPTVQNPIADLTLVAGTTQDVDVSGTFDDHDDDTLTYTASSANTSVATVSLSGTTLTVSGVVVAGDTTVTVSASDSSASASDTFTVTVETDTQPVLAAIADQSYMRGVEIEALTLPSSSTGNSPLTYSLSPALPAGLGFDAATRTLSGTPTGLQASTSYTYKVVDANADEATQSFNITVLAPLLAAPINFQATAGDARVTLTWDTANDDTITRWEYQQKQGTGGTYGAWMSITNSDEYTTAHALENLTNNTQYFFRLRAVNATGNGASSVEKDATPTAGNNPPTVQNPLTDLTVVAGATQDVDVSGTFDDHDDDTLTYTASSDDTSVATVSLSGTTLTVSGVAAASDTTVTVSASDSSASASDTFAVTVETDTQPGLAAIADQSYTRGVEIAALTLPSSSTGNSPLTYSLSPALPAGLGFDAATRTLSGTPTGLQASTSYTYKVVDANADEAAQSFNITVLTPLPSAPVNFQATAGDARVTLTWDNANDDTITRWEYQQKQGMGDYGAWTSIASSNADTTNHALESLTNDTQYFFRLRAVNATGNGAFSGELSATPTEGNNPPTVQNPLADLTLVAGATLVVDVSETFDDHDDDTLTYTASSDNEFVATVTLSGTTLTVSGVATGVATVTVNATDGNSTNAKVKFKVTVEVDTQPGLAAIADQSYTRGVEIDALTLPASSTGNGAMTYSLSPALPAGLKFNNTMRMLSGTPTEPQASTSYTYKVVDADEDMATQSFNITVRERLFQPEQFSQKILEGMLAVTARSMGESAQTAIEGRFEQYRQWSQEATGESVPTTSQPWRENSPTTLSPGESERRGSEGAGGRGAEGSLVQSHWGAANSSTAMGAGWKSENRETGTPGSRLRSLSLGSLGDVAHSDRTHSGASPGSGMEPSGSVYGQDRQYGSGVDDAPLGPGSTDMSGMRVEELRLSEISFEMSLGDSEKETSWVPVLWGQGDLQHFKGNLARFGMDYQGDLEAAHVGLDLYANNQMLAGLSFMRSLGDMEYTDDGIDRVLESRMHTVHPYLYWQPTERLSVWGIGGLGTGQVEVREPGQTHDFDTDFRMFAAGMRTVLARRGNNEWGLRADVFSAQLETDALEGIAKINGETHRGRLMLEWVHNTALSAGRSMSMQMEAGGRFDGGDADRGSGAETGVRLGYLNANSGLYVALHGRLLVVHESDYQDWGVGVHASWDPGEKQRGLRASVMSSWGQDGGGQITLWDNADAVMHPAGMGALGTSSQYRMEIDVAYGDGMKSLGLPGLLTPYSRLRWTGQGRELSLGTEWSLPARSRQSLPSTLELEITRQENKTGPADLAVLARMSISF